MIFFFFFVKAFNSLFIVVCQCECLTCEYEFGMSMEDKIVMRDKQSREWIFVEEVQLSYWLSWMIQDLDQGKVKFLDEAFYFLTTNFALH